MEQARHWMWTKQNHGLNSHIQASSKPSYDDSWEEQAFAEDAAGQLGGCIWPPRSYSCSFCRREFRSAQALGGHMNVHRRDRAGLKQSPSSHNEIVIQNDHQNHHLPNAYTSFGFQHPSQLYSSAYSPNPNSNPGVIQSLSSSSRVSTTPTQENCCEKVLFPLSSSSSIVEGERKWSPSSCPSSRDSKPNMAEDRYNRISDPRNIEGEKKSRILESDCRAKVDYVKSDLAVSLNLVVRRTRPTISDCEEEGSMGSKRRRTESGNLKSPLSLSLKSNSVDRHHVQSEVFEISSCSIDELDLELRLGGPPKVK